MLAIFEVFEWALGLVALGVAALSFLFVMFTDSPDFAAKLTAVQKFAFDYQMLVILGIFVVVVGSFVLQFFIKSVPWRHIVALAAVPVLIWAYLFFSSYGSF